MTNIIPLRKRDHHGDMLSAAEKLDPRQFTEAEKRLNADLAAHLEREFGRDPDFMNRVKESW